MYLCPEHGMALGRERMHPPGLNTASYLGRFRSVNGTVVG